MKNTEGWLPTTAKEVKALGWDYLDVILFSGDAYIDHPSFGIAVIARLLEAEGLRVAVVPQPNWRDDLRDFTKLGTPRLFFGVGAGSMDSMVNHYTAAKRLRSDDAYTPGGKAGFRPDRAATVYSRILKQLFPHTPVVLGGIEASLRRLTHYDYWDDTLKPSVLVESGADVVAYGMGDTSIVEIARALRNGYNTNLLRRLKQVAFVADADYVARLGKDPAQTLMLHSFEECKRDKRKFAENFARIETESNLLRQTHTIIEPLGENEPQEDARQEAAKQGGARQGGAKGKCVSQQYIVVTPPHPVMDTATLDRTFDLPYKRLPHPRYDGKGDIPAWEMIKNSVNIHRGCFGGCSFCTISAHQGKFITSRSEASILKEVERLTTMPYFKGYISDLGGPSANMYGMAGRDASKCAVCRRPSCLHPRLCPNLDNSHRRLLELYRRASATKGVKKTFIGSGIRYDLFESGENSASSKSATGASDKKFCRQSVADFAPTEVRGDGDSTNSTAPATRRGGTKSATLSRQNKYLREVIVNHTSGRLKVAPEHTEEHVLKLMRKPSWSEFERLNADFRRVCDDEGLRYQLIPYFISSHPGCTDADMSRLSEKTRRLHVMTEQVQDLTPTPMTLASVMFYTGEDPYTHEKLYVARSQDDKRRQKNWFFKKA